ncbi:MAG: acyl-CoA dehydrogenase family protein [Saprospiraceae bacterium]
METTLMDKTKVLKGGEFVIKNTNYQDVFTPEDMNEEQGMVREMCSDFIIQEVQPKQHKIANQVGLLQKAGELGILGAHIPEAYGGMEMDTNTVTLITEEFGQGGGSFSTSFAAHTGIGMLPILYFGTEEQKQKYLPKLSTGELKAAYCLTEPSSGSDALAAKTIATLSEDGTEYILNGQKMWITNGGFADVFTVFAQVDGDKFTGFIVEKGTEGLTLGAEEDKMGIKGSSTRQVFLENVHIPVTNLLGQIGKGHLIAFNVLNVGRFKLGAMCMGGNKMGATMAVKYANERVQFKTPIANFGAIQYKLAEMAIRNFALESTVYRVSDMLSDMKNQSLAEGMSYADAMMQAAEDYSVECAIIKVYGSEVTDFVMDENVQVHGGLGFSEEYGAAKAYRDSRINRIYEGTNEINRLLAVNMLLKKAMKGQLDLVGPAWAVQKELASMPSFATIEGKYGKEVKALADFKKVLLIVAGAAAKAQMDGNLNLRKEQMIVMNIADIMIDVFNAESTLLRIQKLADKKSDDEMSAHNDILSVFMQDANDRIAKNAKDALFSFSEGDELRIMTMGVKRYTKFDGVNVVKARRAIAKKMIEANEYAF